MNLAQFIALTCRGAAASIVAPTWSAWSTTRKAAGATVAGMQVTLASQGAAAAELTTDAASANKYWEITIGSVSGNVPGVGIVRDDYTDWTGVTGYTSLGAVAYNADGSLDWWVTGGSANETTGGTTFAPGDVMGLCLKNGALYIGKAAAGVTTWINGCDPETETGALVSGITGRYGPAVCAYSSGTRVMTGNLGASPWVGAAPTLALGWFHVPTLGAHTMFKGEDHSTATPVVTSALTTQGGSSFLISRGAAAAVTTTPTDNKSNTFVDLASPEPYNGFPTFDARHFMALNGFGGSGHTVTLDNSAASSREVTLALVEIVKDGTESVHLSNQSFVYPASGATITSAPITVNEPCLLVAIWTGDAAGLVQDAVPSAGWHVIDSFLNLPPNSAIQYAVAVREVLAGTYDVSWTQSPTQSSPLWIFAFASGAPVPVPMTLVGTLPGAIAGLDYHGELTLQGDFTGPVTIDASVGTMPSWMTASVSGSTVSFDGTPSTAADAVDWTVRATDSSSTPQVATSPQSVAVAAATTTTWNPSYVAFGIALSNGNLTVTCAGDNKGMPTLASCAIDVATAHHYYEHHLDSFVASGVSYVGYCTPTWAVDGPPGSTYSDPPLSFAVNKAGTMLLGQSNKGSCGQTFAAGDTILMYLGTSGGVYIGRLRSGVETWASGHNPKVGGDTPNWTLPAGTWMPACGGDASGSNQAVMTTNFGATAWAATPPTGAVPWVG